MKKYNYIGAVIFLVIAFFYFYFAEKIDNTLTKKAYIDFDTTNIYGVIKEVRIGYQGSVFKVDKLNKKFVFYPHTSELNQFKIFDQFAKNGDTVIKPKFCDTLKLIKNGKQYLYTFQKF